MWSTYDGPWPDGAGFYIGGKIYFKKAPPSFQSIVPIHLGYGARQAILKEMISKL